MKRILLFVGTNLAVLVVLSMTMRLLGIESLLDEQGVGLDMNALLIFAAVIGFSGSFISLLISKWTAKHMTGAKVIESPGNDTERWLLATVSRLAKQANIGMPEVAVYNSPQPNAFATGANKNNALVAVSSGLMQSMTQDEVEAVLAHEISHISNGDMVTMALIQGVVNTFVIVLSRVIGHVVDRTIFKVERGHGPAFWITSIIAELILAFLASIIVLWFSRQREYRADAGAASLVGAPKMIAALQRLAGTATEPLPDQLHALGISGGRGGLSALFMTHPPLEERINALRGHRR
ncbi:protease HtpX [Methylophaga sp. OBS4]|uniref:protease HtpX n=1 Tax=Methylophaga sp. OBS4 TaxID=2991935 RepID=UPI00224F45CA|nr:protease HtpX [Methylophaga sp. OBS4]MCX4188130.1 protease HtpX [Methylophaga sp. OBS4]